MNDKTCPNLGHNFVRENIIDDNIHLVSTVMKGKLGEIPIYILRAGTS